jgi:hypothetical protein
MLICVALLIVKFHLLRSILDLLVYTSSDLVIYIFRLKLLVNLSSDLVIYIFRLIFLATQLMT